MKQLRGLPAVLLALVLFMAACGGSSNDDAVSSANQPSSSSQGEDDGNNSDDSLDDPPATPTEESLDDPPADNSPELDDPPAAADPTSAAEPGPCDNVELTATDIGVTADTITVLAMADVGSAAVGDTFQPSLDAVQAWARHINDEGGLACRQIEVIEHESAINPNLTTNGFLMACNSALALVGTQVLFAFDTVDLQTCPDAEGNEIGVPDFAYITSEVPHQCSEVTFAAYSQGSECPYSGSGPRRTKTQVGHVRWFLENINPDLRGLYYVPSDLPSVGALSIPPAVGYAEVGVEFDDRPLITSATAQSEFGPSLQLLKENNGNFVFADPDFNMLKVRSEAEAQGLDTDNIIWICALACYTPGLVEAGDLAEGTYSWLFHLPYDEVEYNQELADFIRYMGLDFPSAWAAGSWVSGVFFEQVVNEIVAESGPNAVTRQAILDTARNVTAFDANGWWGLRDTTSTYSFPPCFVLVQLQDSEFVRVHPSEPGEMDCTDSNVIELTGDWLEEYRR